MPYPTENANKKKDMQLMLCISYSYDDGRGNIRKVSNKEPQQVPSLREFA